ALVSKVVVLDEVHAADPFMSTFLERTVEWLAAYGCPVVLLSATLPRARRDALFGAYERGRSAGLAAAPPGERSATTEVPVPAGPEVTVDDYPVVVTTGAVGAARVHRVPRSPRSLEVQVRRLDDDLPTLVDLLTHRLADGGCAVVVRTTVRRAQETAEHLSAALDQCEVVVAHAQFLARDRAARDRDLLAR